MEILGIEDTVYLDLRDEHLLNNEWNYDLIYLLDENGVVCKNKKYVSMKEIEGYKYSGMIYGIALYVKHELNNVLCLRSD